MLFHCNPIPCCSYLIRSDDEDLMFVGDDDAHDEDGDLMRVMMTMLNMMLGDDYCRFTLMWDLIIGETADGVPVKSNPSLCSF